MLQLSFLVSGDLWIFEVSQRSQCLLLLFFFILYLFLLSLFVCPFFRSLAGGCRNTWDCWKTKKKTQKSSLISKDKVKNVVGEGSPGRSRSRLLWPSSLRGVWVACCLLRAAPGASLIALTTSVSQQSTMRTQSHPWSVKAVSASW